MPAKPAMVTLPSVPACRSLLRHPLRRWPRKLLAKVGCALVALSVLCAVGQVRTRYFYCQKHPWPLHDGPVWPLGGASAGVPSRDHRPSDLRLLLHRHDADRAPGGTLGRARGGRRRASSASCRARSTHPRHWPTEAPASRGWMRGVARTAKVRRRAPCAADGLSDVRRPARLLVELRLRK